MLARVIDFQDTVADRFADAQGSGKGHRSDRDRLALRRQSVVCCHFVQIGDERRLRGGERSPPVFNPAYDA